MISSQRTAIVHGADARTVRAYLPQNYLVVAEDEAECTVTISGKDVAGWTLDDYVLPRLASGLMFAKEIESWEPDVRVVLTDLGEATAFRNRLDRLRERAA